MFPNSKRHRITEKNMESRHGVCSTCGPVDLTKQGACAQRVRENSRSQVRDVYFKTTLSRLASYKSRAKLKGREFTLSKIQFEELIRSSCRYCGRRGGGIDRKNSRLGYVPENCVPCCSRCNTAKGSLTVEEFLDWVRLVYNNSTKR